MPARRSLTLYAALLFAAVAALVVSAVGFYLYRSVEEAMLRRSDVMVAGRVEHFRNLLRDNLTLAELKARPRLFENMLGNEQDILLLGQPGEAPIVAVNPRHERLPSLRVVAAGQALNPSVVHAALTHDGIPMRVLAAEVLVGGREPLQITAAHLLLGETRMLAQYRDRVIAAVLLAFLGTALLGWLVLRHGLRPLRTLAAKAAEIHPTSLDTRLNVAAAPAELQQVAQSFNAMLERLDDGYQRLQQFSADLAHEIRTPIGSLMGHGQVALRQPRSNEEYQALIASNQEELERIARMVESILFLARADDVRAAVERSRLDLGEELRRQAEYFEGLAEERGLSLDVQVSGQLRADPQLFRRALSNLLANAIRYASADSLIEVRGLRRSGEFLLSVENACDRLPAEPLSRLFDRFYRGDAAAQRRPVQRSRPGHRPGDHAPARRPRRSECTGSGTHPLRPGVPGSGPSGFLAGVRLAVGAADIRRRLHHQLLRHFLDARVEGGGHRADRVRHRHVLQRRLVDPVFAGDALGLHPEHQQHRVAGHQHVEQSRTEVAHQRAGHQRTDTGADPVGGQEHRRQRDPARLLDVVVGQRHRQRIEGEQQHAGNEPVGQQQPVRQRHQPPHRDRGQAQQHRIAADQPTAVEAVGQPTQRPLRTEAGDDAHADEETRLRGIQAVAVGVDRRQARRRRPSGRR